MTTKRAPKKPKVPARTDREAEDAMLAERLRYMDPKAIARDFKGPRERAAIVAVLKWLRLNSYSAWRMKRPGQYSVTARSRSVQRAIGTSTASVLEDEAYDAIAKIFLPEGHARRRA